MNPSRIHYRKSLPVLKSGFQFDPGWAYQDAEILLKHICEAVKSI